MQFQHHPSTLALYFEFKETFDAFVNLISGFNKEAVSMTVDVSYWMLIMLRSWLFFGGRAIF